MKKAYRLCALCCAFIMLLTTILAGCSGSTTDDGATSPSASTSGETTSPTSDVAWDTSKEDTVVISVINNYYTAGEKQLAEDYMALHPETTVVVDVVASNDAYMTKLKTTMTTDINTAPDIVHANFASGVAGSWTSSYAKNYIMDLSSMLDEPNPYNDNQTVGSVFDESIIARAISNAGGKLGFLPFDYCGVGFFYNKTIFDQYGLEIPDTFEDFLTTLETLRANGYENPIVAAPESEWFECMIGDVVYRDKIMDLLTQASDAVYDAETMSGNSGIVYSANDPTFDLTAVINDERVKAYMSDNGFNNDDNLFIWTKFAQLAQYFQPNFVASAATDDVTQFEAQISPILASGSWEVGTIVNDLSQLDSSKQFEWGSFTLPDITDNEGYTAPMRSLYVFGNVMGIIPKDDADHEARVKDVLMYWYSPEVAQMMYDVTLSSGNLVQGPPAINGVTLSEENAAYLNGFVSEGSINQALGSIVGQDYYLADDQAVYQEALNNLQTGDITAAEFLQALDSIFNKKLEYDITTAGYDLDPATLDTPAS